MRHRLAVAVLGLLLAGSGLVRAGAASAQELPSPPAEACDLLGTVGSTASGIQTTVEARTGQALPANLAAVMDGIAARAGCDGQGGGGGPTPAELCGLLATLSSTAAGVQAAVEAQAGQSLPVSLAGTVGQVAAGAGCGGGEPAQPPSAPAPLCAVLGALPSTAGTVQQAVQDQTGQALPVDLASTIGGIVAEAGCTGGGGEAQPAAEACGLLDTVASTAGTLQRTVQDQTGQALPVDLASTLADVAAQAGCPAAAGGGVDEPGEPDDPNGSAGIDDDGASASAGVSEGGASADASVSVAGELPRTGGDAALPAVGGGVLAGGVLIEVLRRRLTAG